MIVYADVLLVLNFYVDYLLLLATEKLCRIRVRFRRRLLGAAFSAVLSLSVLWQSAPVFFPYVVQASGACLTVLITYGRAQVWPYLRRVLSFLAASYVFAGIVLAIQAWLKPDGVFVSAGVVYWTVSPWLLLASTTACYLAVCLYRRFFQRSERQEHGVSLTLTVGERSTNCMVLYDTGSRLFEPISGDPVVVIDPMLAQRLLGDTQAEKLITDLGVDSDIRCRMVPYQSVGKNGVLPAFRPDGVLLNGRPLSKLFLAVSPTRIREGYDGIIGPDAIEEGVQPVCCR